MRLLAKQADGVKPRMISFLRYQFRCFRLDDLDQTFYFYIRLDSLDFDQVSLGVLDQIRHFRLNGLGYIKTYGLGLDETFYFQIRLDSLGLCQNIRFEIILKNKLYKKYEGFFELPVKPTIQNLNIFLI